VLINVGSTHEKLVHMAQKGVPLIIHYITTIVIIIIITGRTATFNPYPSSEDSSIQFLFIWIGSSNSLKRKGKISNLASNPQLKGLHPCIYVPLRQGVPLIPRHWNPLRCLPHFARMRWMYSNQLAQGNIYITRVLELNLAFSKCFAVDLRYFFRRFTGRGAPITFALEDA
jgi:hypothetical protein